MFCPEEASKGCYAGLVVRWLLRCGIGLGGTSWGATTAISSVMDAVSSTISVVGALIRRATERMACLVAMSSFLSLCPGRSMWHLVTRAAVVRPRELVPEIDGCGHQEGFEFVDSRDSGGLGASSGGFQHRFHQLGSFPTAQLGHRFGADRHCLVLRADGGLHPFFQFFHGRFVMKAAWAPTTVNRASLAACRFTVSLSILDIIP